MKRINKEIYEIKENYKNIDDNVNIYIEVYLPDNYINEPLDIIYLHGVINETEIFERVIDNYFLSVNLNKILVRLVYKYNEIISDYIKNIIVNEINKKYLTMRKYLYCEKEYSKIGFALCENDNYECLCLFKPKFIDYKSLIKVVLIDNSNIVYNQMIDNNMNVKLINKDIDYNNYLYYFDYLFKELT